jgi:hypothetical protein
VGGLAAEKSIRKKFTVMTFSGFIIPLIIAMAFLTAIDAFGMMAAMVYFGDLGHHIINSSFYFSI